MGTRKCIHSLLFFIIFIFVCFSTVCFADISRTGIISQNGIVTANVTGQNVSVNSLIRFVDESVVYAERNGRDAALKEFSDPNGSFSRGEMYIWAYNFDGINLAHPWHPEYLGKNKLDLMDPDGFHMIEAMRNTARNGSGFVWYQFDNPVSGKTEPKISYVKRVDDSWWLASGIYGTNLTVPEISPESVQTLLSGLVLKAGLFAKEHGKEEALAAFNNPEGPFVTNETYIFAFDMNGTTLAMPFAPGKVGMNEKNLTDINGVSIGNEKLIVAESGGGFWYYVFGNPNADNSSQFKVSYVYPVSPDLVVGAGLYLPDIPVIFTPEKREELKKKVREAISYANEIGKDKAIHEFNDPEGRFSDPDMFIFAFDSNGTLLANPYLPGLVGLNRMNDRDSYGKFAAKQLIANAKNGGGYSYYFFADPGSDYAIRLKLGYSEQADNNLIVGSGIFPEY